MSNDFILIYAAILDDLEGKFRELCCEINLREADHVRILEQIREGLKKYKEL